MSMSLIGNINVCNAKVELFFSTYFNELNDKSAKYLLVEKPENILVSN